MGKLHVVGLVSYGIASLICAGIMLFGSVLPLSAQVSTNLAEKPKGALLANAVVSLDDLAERFLDAQSDYQVLTPPSSDFILRQEGGVLVFDPQDFPEAFSSALIGLMEHDCPVYTVTGIEDPSTRAVIFINADGVKIANVAESAGYDPWWLLNRSHPDLYSGRYSQQAINQLKADFDPARVHITWKLLPVEYAEKYEQAVADIRAQNIAKLLEAGLDGGISPMMLYQGTGMTNLEIVTFGMVTNGMKLTLAYPDDFTNRVDFFTCSDLITSWWDLAVDATNVNTSTNFIEWVDSSAMVQGARFYTAGNADLDTDGDGISDAREKYMYHTNYSTNDTDHDGLHDDYEILTLHTDPNNPKTNKPNVLIAYPVSDSRKIWLP